MQLEESGIYTIPCEINGLRLRFVFDTGASDVHLSLLDAAFMLKNGYISKDDFVGVNTYSMADGTLSENATVILKEIKIGNLYIKNIKACISSKINASLLLGQSAIKKLGKYTIDGNFLILHNSVDSSNPFVSGEDEYVDSLCDNNLFNLPNGDVYEGDTKDNYIEGRGTYTWTNGDKYAGQWQHGQRHGQGIFYYANGDKYVGNWVNDKREGYGVMYFADKEIYVGNWKDDMFNGSGLFKWPDGDYYKGSFVNNYREGEGTFVWSDGSVYVGSWKLGKSHGYGVFTHPDGKKESGIWENDVMVSSKEKN